MCHYSVLILRVSSLPQTAGDARKQDTEPQTPHCKAAAHSIAHS